MPYDDLNPMEALVEEMSDAYPEMVFDLVAYFAPEKPWWHPKLSADAQLWRYMTGGRPEIIDWLYEAGAALGWEGDEVLANLEALFTDPGVVVRLPLDVAGRIPIPLLEMVQAAGPHDSAVQIRKLEKAIVGRMQAMDAIAEARPDFSGFFAEDEAAKAAVGPISAEY